MRYCVFCGSSVGARSEYLATARELGATLARRGIGLVYGGSNVGLMGELADAALSAGGHVIGVIPEALVEAEVAHPSLSELRVVESMHARKSLMAELSDGFMALPGGIGTLEELLEILTWAQLGVHRHPCGVIDVGGYFEDLQRLLHHAVDERFLRAEHRDMLMFADSVDGLLERFESYTPPTLEKWIERSAT